MTDKHASTSWSRLQKALRSINKARQQIDQMSRRLKAVELREVYLHQAILMDRWRELPGPVVDLRLAEVRVFSQNGEDGIIAALVNGLENVQETFVEFGAGGGGECNTRFLIEILGWSGTYFEPGGPEFEALSRRHGLNPRIGLYQEAVTPEHVGALFEQAGVPSDVGILSIDVDGQDFWIWKALPERYQPAIVIIEFNASLIGDALIVERKGWPWTARWVDTVGSSLAALSTLGERKGYKLVHTMSVGVNAFFVRQDLLEKVDRTFRGETVHPPNLWKTGGYHPHDPAQRSRQLELNADLDVKDT